MSLIRSFFFAVILAPVMFPSALLAEEPPAKKILIVVEGSSDTRNFAMGIGRQVATLLGHFNTSVTMKGVNTYAPHELEGYDYTFYCGFNPKNSVPNVFCDDVYRTEKPVIWLSTGFVEFSERFDVGKRFGFKAVYLDSSTAYDVVRAGSREYARQEMTTTITAVLNRSIAKVFATAYALKKRKEVPYIIQSRNLLYFADSPFAYTGDSDRYLLFADMLHDILKEQHEDFHTAIVRLEDIDVYEDPNALREVADILSNRGIPFLIGVIPFYVDPSQGIRLSLSDRPELVDALQYMVKNGGTIVMHGVTHQYKGKTAVDYEFWDENTNRPIKDETPDGIARKLEMGIQEFMKNGLYPLVWETPHYTASFDLYKTVTKYFSTACEQRLAIEDAEFSQYFPYLIKKDLFGQTIYPENLGFIAMDQDKNVEEAQVQSLLKNAKSYLTVRDGIASFFFHPFLNLDLLKEIVDGMQLLGYTFIDLREQTNWVKNTDRVILSGSQTYTITLNDQYLLEAYFDESGEIRDRTISETRYKGPVTRTVTLKPREFYKAEPTEFIERKITFFENIAMKTEKAYENIFSAEPMRAVILWNHFARGAGFNDQASFASVLQSVNVKVDTFFVGQPLDLARYNLLIVPYAFVDSMKQRDYDAVTAFVENGGNIITDTKNELAIDLGIRYIDARLRVRGIHDRLYPEEQISWRYAELVNKFESDVIDEVFCTDEGTDAPMIIGRKFGKGKVIYINSRFDPSSRQGYSLYPFLLEYIRKYFELRPILRRENLEVYFDPGFRHAYSIEQLVAQWVTQGIRRVHVAGWHQYPKYTYDYDRLIRVAHANGILVFAWLEPPQVSQKFWLDHPEWREKNYKGEDIQPSWRYPVALTEPKCLNALVGEYRRCLERYDWDGVNLAELYFDAGRGFTDPRLFTPMHPSARAEVKRKYGFDLTSIFDPQSPFYWKSNDVVRKEVVNYRIEKLNEVYRLLLDSFSSIVRTKEGFQLMVTAMDSYGSPEVRENIGVDMKHILALQKEYKFSLQVEDPENRWSTDPMRYVEIGKLYAGLIGDRTKLLLDLNILSFRKKTAVTPFPTLIQTGTESFHLVRAAAIGAPRMTIYSESSVNPQDLRFFANAAAADVQQRYTPDGYEVGAPTAFSVKMPKDVQEIIVDGDPTPAFRDNLFLIPAGNHTISLDKASVGSFSTHQLETHLMSITANLLTLTHGLRDVSFTYESDMRTLASFSNYPTTVTVDGSGYPVTVMKGNDCFTIMLPTGRHDVRVVAGDQFSYGINVTSLWSTTAIAIFGAVAVTLLLLMYIMMKFVKRKTNG
jgi:uncharacterized protein YdaL